MKKKLEINLLILRLLIVDFVLNAWKKLVTLVKTQSSNSTVGKEATRFFLIGRYHASLVEKFTRIRISAVGTTILAVIIVFSLVASAQVFSVSVNGQIVGYVNERDDYAQLVNNIKEKISKENGNSEIIIKESDIQLKPAIKPSKTEVFSISGNAVAGDSQGADEAPAVDDNSRSMQPLLAQSGQESGNSSDSSVNGPSGDAIGNAPVPLSDSPADAGTEVVPKTDDLEEVLLDALIREDVVKATVYDIVVNEKPVATLATMTDASAVLQNVANTYKVDLQDEKSGFVDDVQIIGKTTELNSIRIDSVEKVTDMLVTGSNITKTYAAKDQDTAQIIADGLGITEEELRVIYPDNDFILIREGDVFEHVINTPYLKYETSGIEEIDLPIPFETVEKRTNALYYGESEVESAGEEGIRHVVRAVTRINGEIVVSEEFYSEVVKEPINATTLTGTLLLPGDIGYKSDTGSGKLGRPLDSWSFSRGVGGAHQGDDFLAPRGTPIYSAESGTVVHAGWFSAYGLLVRVNHGNGLETYYAHCDTINVAEGQVVERGQQIATVGITGRATAFHLHFEVRVNGVPQEPLDWIG